MRVVICVELQPEQTQRICTAFPDVTVLAPGDDEQALREAAAEAEVLFGGRKLVDLLPLAPHLRWIQTFSAGINFLPLDILASKNILLTNASGAHAVQMSENVLAMMLAFAIRLPALVRAQTSRDWISDQVDAEKFDLDGQSLLIIGLGGIGAAVAGKAAALGLKVMGIRNHGATAPEGVSELIPSNRLIDALGRADHVVLCLPLTDATIGFIGETELRAMKRTAYIYNVGRGQSIQREPLIRALREGWIAGAGLDVTDPEPLPADDPLWDFHNVILTQHTSGGSPRIDERVTDIFIENLGRYLRGEPLRNLIDYTLQY